MVIFDDAPGDGHAQPGPGRLGGKEGIEDPFADGFRDAAAVVAHRDADLALAVPGGGDRTLPVPAMAWMALTRTLSRTCLIGAPVDLDLGSSAGQFEHEGDPALAAAVPRQEQGLLHQLAQVGGGQVAAGGGGPG